MPGRGLLGLIRSGRFMKTPRGTSASAGRENACQVMTLSHVIASIEGLCLIPFTFRPRMIHFRMIDADVETLFSRGSGIRELDGIRIQAAREICHRDFQQRFMLRRDTERTRTKAEHRSARIRQPRVGSRRSARPMNIASGRNWRCEKTNGWMDGWEYRWKG